MGNIFFRDSVLNDTYGGRDLLKLGKTAQGVAEQVRNNDFSDLYIGDYFTTDINNRQIKWHIADFNYFLNIGDTIFTKPHLVLINDVSLMEVSVNNTDTTEGGYYNSNIKKNMLPICLSNLKKTDLGNYILTHRDLFTNRINDKISSSGCHAWLGCSVDYGWYNSTIELLTEPQVYGTAVYGSSGFDIGTGYTQFSIFKLNKKFTYMIRQWWWLRSVASHNMFCGVSSFGWASADMASKPGSVRIYFCFG